MRKCRSGFTLVELLIVMGIVVLFVTMAIPSVRVMTGARSISVSQNQLSAVLAHAREEAIALQTIRGVLFYLDPISGRVGAVVVQQSTMTDTTNVLFNTVLLDTVPGNDSLLLPVGVRVQTIINGFSATNAVTGAGSGYVDPTSGVTGYSGFQRAMTTQAALSASQKDDRYLGFNPVIGATIRGSGQAFYAGGCILFDGSGRLIVRPYAFQMSAFISTGVGASNLCKFMGYDSAFSPPTAANPNGSNPTATFLQASNGSLVIMPGCAPNSPMSSGSGRYFPAVPVMSQTGLIMFDYDSFRTLGFTDYDSDINAPSGITYTTAWPTNPSSVITAGMGGSGGDGIHSEFDKENWLDSNSTPVMINRYNGTLIRGE